MKRRFALLLIVLALASGIPSQPAARAQDTGLAPVAYLPMVFGSAPGPAWLSYLNGLRALADLPLVADNPAWSAGAVNHSIYIVKNDDLSHFEDSGNPFYTPEGDEAGQNSNVMATSALNFATEEAIDMWMQGPFHGIGMIDPRLQQTGYGEFRESGGSISMAATIDVLRGRTGGIAPGTFPVIWPANGKVMPYIAYTGGEFPDPLSSCPGFVEPSGPPLYVQLGSGSITPNITAVSFSQSGTDLPICVYTETNYNNPDGNAQSLARQILNSRDAIVIIPRSPLVPGATYNVSLTVNGTNLAWSFMVSSSATMPQQKLMSR